MKILWLIFLFICVSCQLASKGGFSSKRDVASLFKNNTDKFTYEHEWEIGQGQTWIANSSLKNIISIDVLATDVVCNGKNIVKVHAPDKQTFYLTDKSKVHCTSETTKKVKVNYHYYGQTLVDVNQEHIDLIQEVLKKLEEDKLFQVMEQLKQLGLFNLYKKRISLEELNKVPFMKGDFVQVEIAPQVRTVYCPDGKCSFDVDVFGLLDYDKMNFIKGMNQLKYQELPPYLFFCGSRYTAGNIYFRADVKMDMEHFIDENGFSCDVNSFMLSENKSHYEVSLNWISKEKIQTILMGKREIFIEQKNMAIKNEIISSITYLEKLNQLYNNEVFVADKSQIGKGHIELWWEPFDKCDPQVSVECLDKEMIMTRSRLITENKNINKTVELNLVSLGLKQIINSEEPLVAFVVKLCPEDVEEFVMDQVSNRDVVSSEASFKSRILSYQKASCDVNQKLDSNKDFNYRWLLATIPKSIEREEVDLVIEDYQLIESPKEETLKMDPFQKGKIFFDIYIKNLKKREVPFKRSRIIEVTK